MTSQNSLTIVERTAYLRPKRSDNSEIAERKKLVLAITEADQLGFEETKAALMEMLRCNEGRS